MWLVDLLFKVRLINLLVKYNNQFVFIWDCKKKREQNYHINDSTDWIKSIMANGDASDSFLLQVFRK